MIDYDNIAADYACHRHIHVEVFRALFSEVGPESNVLEVGCGTGNYIISLAESIGCSCWGIDPSEQMLKRARERSDRVSFAVGKAEAVDLPDASFDLVFSVDVIHHVADCPAFLREAYRMLRPRSRLCTVTENEWMIRNRRPLAEYFPGIVNAELERYPNIAGLRQEMERAGFREISDDSIEVRYTIENIDAYRDKAFSSLHCISEEAFQKGIKRMKQDVNDGPIHAVSRYLLLWGVKH